MARAGVAGPDRRGVPALQAVIYAGSRRSSRSDTRGQGARTTAHSGPRERDEGKLRHPKCKGDRELAAKYVAEAYEASKGAVSSPAGAAVQAGMYGEICEKIGLNSSALLYYEMAMKHGKTVEPRVLRYLLGIKIMYKRSQCYLHLEQYENAEKVLLKAIRGCEKFQGQFSLSQCSPPDIEILDELEVSVFGLFAAYTILLIITDRQNEIPSLRERLLRVVRNSETLREGETEVMDQFDDGAALIAIQDERRRKRQGESGEVKSHSA